MRAAPVAWIAALLALLALAGCGTPYAIVPDGAGRPVIGRLFVFGDVLGQTVWSLDPQWNVDHADRLWPSIRDRGWRATSLAGYASKVPHCRTGAQLRAEFEARDPGRPFPDYDPGGMLTNRFVEPPGWRAAEGFGQPALGYPR
jgi:hypothetical protein